MSLDEAWPVLEPALDIADEGVTREDIEVGLADGRYRLFQEGSSAALVVHYPNRLCIALAGGSLQECQRIDSDIEKYAESIGINRIDIYGREGWLRALPGYRKTMTVMRKDL